MPVIELETEISAPVERVFDLARSIDAHMFSTGPTRERAIGGRTSGLIELGETVTWEATHFGIRQQLTAEITALERPFLFEDVMQKGAFSSMKHRHLFEPIESGTRMKDEFFFRAPLGVFGRIAESTFLTAYMRRFLIRRNQVLKELAESEEWRNYLT
jgi:ligand-binding SRPBCC domain-containing protein